jgi:hypothetical protein
VRVRANEAFEHVGNPVSVSVDANPDHSRVVLKPSDLLALQFPHDDRAPTPELRRVARWEAATAAGHRAEHQLDLVAIAVSIGVAREENRPTGGLFLFWQRHGINASRPILVFRRDLLEENVAIESTESVEDDRSLNPGRSLDAFPGCGLRSWHIVQKERCDDSPQTPLSACRGGTPPAAADLSNRPAGERRGGGFRRAPDCSDDCDENESGGGCAESNPRGSAPQAPLLLGAQLRFFGRDGRVPLSVIEHNSPGGTSGTGSVPFPQTGPGQALVCTAHGRTGERRLGAGDALGAQRG